MTEEIKKRLISYYTKYYRDECSLPQWQANVNKRLHEEENESKRIHKLMRYTQLNFHNKKVCIVGAGTGGLAVVLHAQYNCEVHGLEPSQEELDIIHLKCTEVGIEPTHFTRDTAEHISFGDNEFDIVYCHTVLEHVEDVAKSIDEMIRITRPGGLVYINTPNYTYPREGHYKIPFPTFLPKQFGYLYLRLMGKPYRFLKTINFITERNTQRLLMKRDDVRWQRIYAPLPPSRGMARSVFNYVKFKRGIYPEQEIIITKLYE